MKNIWFVILCVVGLVAETSAKEFILTSVRPNKLLLLDAADGRIVKTYKVAGQTIGSWSIVPSKTDDRVYVTTNNHQTILGIDLLSGQEVFKANLSQGDKRVRSIYGMDVSSNGKRLYAHVNPVRMKRDSLEVLDNQVLVFDTSTGLDSFALAAHAVPRRIQGLMVSSDDKSLYLLGRDYHQMDLDTGRIVRTFPVGSWQIAARTPGEVGGHWMSFEYSDIQTQAVYSVHTDRDPYSPQAYQTGLTLLNRKTGEFKTVDFEYTADLIFATAASHRTPDVFGVYNSLVKIDSNAGKTVKRVPLEATYYTVNTSINGEVVFIGGGGCKVAGHDADNLKRIWGRDLPGCADQSFSWLRVVDLDEEKIVGLDKNHQKSQSKHKLIENYVDAWNRHDVDGVLSYFSESFSFEDLPMGMTARTKGEFGKILEKTFKEVPDFSMTIERIHEGESFVVTEWLQKGTASGEVEGRYIEHLPYQVKTTSVIEFSGKKIIRLSDNWDKGALISSSEIDGFQER